MATVTVTASDTGSGVNTIEYALGADGAWKAYTAPVMVHEVGSHAVRYRATDKSGNVAAEKSVDFQVVEPPSQDKTAPVTSVAVTGDKNSDGAFITSAKATVTATDADSGVDKVEYSLDGGPYLAYTSPVIVDRVGYHTFAHRATDKPATPRRRSSPRSPSPRAAESRRPTARSTTSGSPSSSGRSTRESPTGSRATAARSTN